MMLEFLSYTSSAGLSIRCRRNPSIVFLPGRICQGSLAALSDCRIGHRWPSDHVLSMTVNEAAFVDWDETVEARNRSDNVSHEHLQHG